MALTGKTIGELTNLAYTTNILKWRNNCRTINNNLIK